MQRRWRLGAALVMLGSACTSDRGTGVGGGGAAAPGSADGSFSSGAAGGASTGSTGNGAGSGGAPGESSDGSGGAGAAGEGGNLGGDGATGSDGATGLDGATGSDGATGLDGATRSDAATGSDGATGVGGSGSTSLCPPGITKTITVAQDGSGQFSTVQGAITSIPAGSTMHIRIDIGPGTYKEKLVVDTQSNLCMVGADPSTTILTFDDSAAISVIKTGSSANSYTFMVGAADFSASNLTFENSFGVGSQAVAIRATGLREQFLNCRIVGHQDTLYVQKGTQYFRNCFVQGTVDFIYGASVAVLDGCEVNSIASGVITAPNTDVGSSYGVLLLGGKLTAAAAVKPQSVFLGRPWGPDGQTDFLNVNMGVHIAPAGFEDFDTPAVEARFGEYQSIGAGANPSARAGYQLSASAAASFTIANALGSWTPSYSR